MSQAPLLPAALLIVEVCRRSWLADWLFFFSSRRRHTRFDCDWSSDVCSSDLRPPGMKISFCVGRSAPPDSTRLIVGSRFCAAMSAARKLFFVVHGLLAPPLTVEIGRASCRERV